MTKLWPYTIFFACFIDRATAMTTPPHRSQRVNNLLKNDDNNNNKKLKGQDLCFEIGMSVTNCKGKFWTNSRAERVPHDKRAATSVYFLVFFNIYLSLLLF